VIRQALAGSAPLTRAELAERLAARGVDPAGQRIAHLVHRAGLEGLVCHGPDRGREPTFVLLADWVAPGRPLEREAALAELARRYLAAYGPADPRDLAAWSGLPLRDARAAWRLVAGELAEVRVDGAAAWLPAARLAWAAGPPDRRRRPLVHLLAGFDGYLLGYRSRELAVPAAHARRVWTGGGFIKPTLTVDGRAAGVWSSATRGGRLGLTVAPFMELDAEVAAGVAAEAADVGRFLGSEVALTVTEPG
jgi:hypothetical protein